MNCTDGQNVRFLIYHKYIFLYSFKNPLKFYHLTAYTKYDKNKEALPFNLL